MFTGLVQALGRVRRVEPVDAGVVLWVDVEDAGALWPGPARAGDSVSISGCCLTLSPEGQAKPEAEPGEALGTGPHAPMRFVAIPETLDKTILGGFGPGRRVNLEQCCTPTTALGGHIVQGHVDGVGGVSRVQTGGDWRVRVQTPEELMQFVSPKGSITIDGVSLTIADLSPSESWLEVALIPETLERTTLGDLREGERVNLEADMIAKTVVHWLRHHAPASERTR